MVSNKGVGKKRVVFCVFCVFCLLFTLVSAPSQAASAASSRPKVERMSFIEAPVGYILQSLGRIYGVNFSISSSAAGRKVSVELNDVSFEEALAMVSQAAGVEVDETGKGLYVVRVPEESTTVITEKERDDERKEKKLTSSIMEVVSVKYVSVADIEETIKKTIMEGEESLVKVSKISTDDTRSYSTLVLTAPNKKLLETVKKIIATIDTPRPMVEIEVLFVELIKSGTSDTGIDWQMSTEPFKFKEGAALGELTEVMDPFRFGTFGRLTPWQAEAALKSLKVNSKSRVLADPKIRVMSGRKAMFASETQVPILSKNKDGDVNTEWKNVGINLEILPVVLGDGTIYLKTIPRASSITGEKKLGDVTAPVISERKAETEVLMNPGETMVIGGLMSDKEIRTLSKVPLLSQIPLIGALFQSERKENEKSTVVIFLRPHLVSDSGAAGGTDYTEKEEQVTKMLEGGVLKKVEDLPADEANSLNERIEKLRRELQEKEKARSAEKGTELKKNNKEGAALPAPSATPPQKAASAVKEPKEIKPIEITDKKTVEKKTEETRESTVEKNNNKEPHWKNVGDIDEYLKKLTEEYASKDQGMEKEEKTGEEKKNEIKIEIKKEKTEKPGENNQDKAPDSVPAQKEEIQEQPASGWIPPME